MAQHEANEGARGRRGASREKEVRRRSLRETPEKKPASTGKKKRRASEAETPVKKKKTSAPEAEAPAPKGRHSAPEAEAPAPKGRHSAPEAEAPAPKKKPDAPKAEEAAAKKKPDAPEAEEAAAKKKPDAPEAEDAAPKKKKRPRSIEDYLDAEPKKAPKRPSKRQLRRQRATRRAIVVAASLLLALLCGALYAGSCVSASDTNLPNVYLDGIAIGGLTKEQTAETLSAQGWDQEAQRPLTVELPAGVRFEVDKQKAGSALPLQKAVNAAFAYGHSGSWLADLGCWLRSYSGGVNLGDFAVTLNEPYLDSVLQEGLAAFEEATAGEASYTVDRENECLRMRKGAGIVTIDAAKLAAAVREALLTKQETLRYEQLENLPAAPDFEEIYRSLAVEPQDAYFDEDWEVVDETVGCTFAVEQALAVWNETPWLEEALIPLTITWPETTGEGLRALLFRDKLGEQTSYFPNSIQNRISNIQLAASKINGVVLKPGEVFSYNETVGERTLDNGFLMAAAYSNGEVVEELGGGICQVSSTLYCAVLYSQLNLRSRDSHYFKVDYLPWGQDATVSWPQPDFKFINSRDYPIRIHAEADPVGRSITVEIWGTDTLGTHIELYEDRYTIYDETWGVATGWNVYLYANVFDAEGNLIETRELPASTYHKHDEDIDWPAAKYEADAAQNG